MSVMICFRMMTKMFTFPCPAQDTPGVPDALKLDADLILIVGDSVGEVWDDSSARVGNGSRHCSCQSGSAATESIQMVWVLSAIVPSKHVTSNLPGLAPKVESDATAGRAGLVWDAMLN